ncbi:MAG TPA: 3-deoxy-D-manno-octulosonic acid transferase [Candidatus Sulfotelmatobacter sp.]
MSYLLYSVALALGLLLSLPFWLFQIARHGKYWRSFPQRIGKVPKALTAISGERLIWIHAVSVGEVLAVAGLIAQVRQAFPQHRIVVSSTTDTGHALAQKRFGAENAFYFPLDFAFAIRPYLRALRPEVVVLAETEFWPNFIRLAHTSGARIAVVNARISDRSWPNYRRFTWALQKILRHVDLFLAQTQQDSDRLQSIGADPTRIRVTGNLKFDVSLPSPPPILEPLRQALNAEGAGPVLVCGSTVEDEERLLLKAFENILVKHSKAVMILAPRHPERFRTVAGIIQQMGIPFHLRLRWSREPLAGSVFLLDTIGELAALYGLADLAFVGGSLVPRGGHNIIEPAQHGVAVVTGNHTENFRDIVSLFQGRDAVRIVGMAELPLVLMQLIENDVERAALGRRAKQTIQSQMGATARTLQALSALLLQTANPAPPSAQAAHNH